MAKISKNTRGIFGSSLGKSLELPKDNDLICCQPVLDEIDLIITINSHSLLMIYGISVLGAHGGPEG